MVGIAYGVKSGLRLLGQFGRVQHVRGELARHCVHQCPQMRPMARPLGVEWTIARQQVGKDLVEPFQHHPCLTLNQSLNGTVGQTEELHHLGERSHTRDLIRLGLVAGRGLM